MLKYTILICLTLYLTFVNSFVIENVKISKKSRDFINVNNTESCGGEADFLGLRVPDCTASPCQLPINLIHQIETDFRLKTPTQSIRFTNSILIGGVPVPIFEQEIDGPFNPIDSYTLEYTFQQAQPVTLDVRFTLHSASGVLQICRGFILVMVDPHCLEASSSGVFHRNRTITMDKFLTSQSEIKNVEGVTNCGSNGNFNALFVPGCTTQPCRLRANQIHTLSFLFYPSRTTECVEFEQFVNIFGQWISIHKENNEERLTPGSLTLLAYDLFAAELLDFEMPLRSVVRTDDNQTELCLEFNVIFFA